MKQFANIRFFLVLFSFIGLSGLSFAQRVDEFEETFHEAEYVFFSEENYEDALKLFTRLEKMQEENANVKYYIAACYLRLTGDKNKAIPYLEAAVKNVSVDYEYGFEEKRAPLDAFYYLGYIYHINNRLDEAMEVYNEFLSRLSPEEYLKVDFIEQQIEACKIAHKFQDDPIKFEELEINENINRLPFNFSPAVSGDASVMAFTSSLGGDNKIFVCRKISGKWSNPKDITSLLELRGSGTSSSLSYNGEELFITVENQFESDIYLSRREDGKWIKAKKLGKNVNTKYWESGGSLSPDGKCLYFASNRKGGYGELDIYVSELNEKGKWGKAVNLGSEINSPFHDASPVLQNDGKSLYFSSQGHYNMGGYDLFTSVKDDDAKWSTPVNLGYPINSTDDDMNIVPVGNGDVVCYAPFTESGEQGQKIRFIALDTGSGKLEATVQGKIDTDDNYPELTNAFVKVVEKNSGDTVKVVKVDPETGEYSLSMLEGSYSFIFSGDGYEENECNLIIPEHRTTPDINLNQELKSEKLMTGDYILLKNILFAFNEYKLDKEARMELERAIDVLRLYPDLEFEIEGHTDAIGNAEYNMELSAKRARSVLNYLVGRGLDRSRFRTKGYGEIVAVAINDEEEKGDDPEIRRLNRRVEFKVLRSETEVLIEKNVFIPDLFKDNKSLKYTVVVMKVKEKLSKDFFDQFAMKELEYVKEEKTADGYIYTLGVFLQKNEAFRITGDLKKVGLTEARVVDQHELSEIVGEDRVKTEAFFGLPETTNELPVYTIQVLALKWLIDSENSPKYRKYKGTTVYKSKSGYYRYTIGEYKGFTKAKAALKELKLKGHKDAFIRRKSDYEGM